MYSLVSLATRLITPRSKSSHLINTRLVLIIITLHRVLLAGIKFLGACPCPHCLVKKADLPKMGMVRDMRQRIKKTRVDDKDRCCRITAARWLIFQKGVAVNGERVNGIAK